MGKTMMTRDGFEIDVETCMDGPDGCHGPVELRFSRMGTPNPRCAAHQARRDRVEEHIRELESPAAPADFDPSDAGEAWGEEDY